MRLASLKQTNSFLAPLKRKTTALVVEDRETNLKLAQFLLSLASLLKWKVLVLDTDAFYTANITKIFEGLPENQRRGVSIRIPNDESGLDEWMVKSVFAEYNLLIVDDMNALHHLLDSLKKRSGSRTLHFIERILSYVARSENRTAILTSYKNIVRSAPREKSRRSLSRQGDLVVSVALHDFFIRFKCDQGRAWTGNAFSVRI